MDQAKPAPDDTLADDPAAVKDWAEDEGGRQESLVSVFGRHQQHLLRMIAARLDPRILGKVDAEDILQEVYIEATRRNRDPSAFPTVPYLVWLRQVATQVLIDTHRRYLGAKKRDVRREVAMSRAGPADPSSLMLVGQLAGNLTTPSQCAAREEMFLELRTALAALEEADREVLILRHLEEWSNNEIALILGIDKYAASKRYLRALERLRRAMTTDAVDRDPGHEPAAAR
jgi:RNA polymerase sigma-70 factor (ECF subfamily)